MAKYYKLIYLLSLLILPLIAANAQTKPIIKFGGALRFNYNNSSWKDGQQKRGGDFGYDFFRVNANVAYNDLKLNAEYRLLSDYFGGGMLKQGWVEYDFNEYKNLQIGLTQVPFGLTTYNSSNWFFSINYYVGLEDDHDMGIKYSYTKDNWEMNLAFFKNAEELRFGGSTDTDMSRYSYDVGSITINEETIYRDKEINQLNGKLAYNLKKDETTHQFGVSGQYGGLYNIDTNKSGNHFAFAGHYRLNSNKWGVKAQALYYKYNPEHPTGQDDTQIAMVAYGASYLVASEAYSYTLGLSYTLPIDWHPISSLMFYNDFGIMDKVEDSFEDTYMNVSGILVTAGQIYTYIDYAMGKNQPWLGSEWTNALGTGTSNAEWEARFNINIGYYF